jgi:molybdopterin-guanine dinucleotide biosynthesis protein B
VLLSSHRRYALMHELRGEAELTVPEAFALLGPCELALVEGFKTYPMPKLEIWRAAVGRPLLHPRDPTILAVATDDPAALGNVALPVLHLGDVDKIATLVAEKAAVWPVAD